MNMFVRIIITYLIREFIFNKPTLAPFPQKSYLTSGTWVVAVTGEQNLGTVNENVALASAGPALNGLGDAREPACDPNEQRLW